MMFVILSVDSLQSQCYASSCMTVDLYVPVACGTITLSTVAPSIWVAPLQFAFHILVHSVPLSVPLDQVPLSVSKFLRNFLEKLIYR